MENDMTPPLLTDDEVAARLLGIPWNREGKQIVRDIKLENFDEAVMLVDRVAEIASSVDHHPDILIHGWNMVKLTLSTHSAGGLTEIDFDMAARLDALIQQFRR
jgi:4a-hydroxytetrahydrobiopterin dehydratase